MSWCNSCCQLVAQGGLSPGDVSPKLQDLLLSHTQALTQPAMNSNVNLLTQSSTNFNDFKVTTALFCSWKRTQPEPSSVEVEHAVLQNCLLKGLQVKPKPSYLMKRRVAAYYLLHYLQFRISNRTDRKKKTEIPPSWDPIKTKELQGRKAPGQDSGEKCHSVTRD